jgi:3-oxoacyl-[acyl-carrier-protein] synthase-3
MIGIKAIGSYVPDTGHDLDELVARFGVDPGFLRDKTGFVRVSRKDPTETASALCIKAYEDLASRTDLSDIECLVVCTQNPDGFGIPHTGGIIHGLLNLPSTCAVFDISLGCSGYVYGLSVVTAFMQQNGMKRGLFFTADPYSLIIDETDKNTALLFGDGATVTLLDLESPLWTAAPFKFASYGASGSAIQVDASRHLVMNGRAVFNFSSREVPPLISGLMLQQGLTDADIDFYLLHQGSRYIVETIARTLEVDAGKVPFGASQTGNTVSSSLPLMLKDLQPSSARKIIMAGFGVGLSAAACILSAAA